MESECSFLSLYQRHLQQKEWPDIKPKPAKWDEDAGWRNSATPLLISECGRIITRWDPVKKIFRSHPCNMPDVSIEVIELVGEIVRRHKTFKYLKYHVWDGSGTIQVNFKLTDDIKEKAKRSEIDKHFGVTPEMYDDVARRMNQVISDEGCTAKSVEQRQRFQHDYQDWWNLTYKGMYGKTLKVGDYVNVFGFCALKYNDPTAVTSWDVGMLPKMIFAGLHIDAIDEETHYNKLSKLIHEGLYKYGINRKRKNPEQVIEAEPEAKEEIPISVKSEDDSSLKEVHWSQYMKWGTDGEDQN